ncbi:MAG TPA: hypothetical protein PLK32_08155 [Defluviitoga tunisiensis]|nr:hypothetical protein [Defluviitoga tunisiensis]
MYKVLYTLYRGNRDEGDGVAMVVTNKVKVSEVTGIGYHTLVNEFTKKRRVYYEGGGWVVIKSLIFEKGRPRNLVGNFRIVNNLKNRG